MDPGEKSSVPENDENPTMLPIGHMDAEGLNSLLIEFFEVILRKTNEVAIMNSIFHVTNQLRFTNVCDLQLAVTLSEKKQESEPAKQMAKADELEEKKDE